MIAIRFGLGLAVVALAACLFCACDRRPEADASQEEGAQLDKPPSDGESDSAAPVDKAVLAEIIERFKNGETALREDAIIAALPFPQELYRDGMDKRLTDRRLVVISEYGDESEEEVWEFTLKRLDKDGPVTLAKGLVAPLRMELVHAWPVPDAAGNRPDLKEIRNVKVQFANVDTNELHNEYLWPSKTKAATGIIGKALTENGWMENTNDCYYIWLIWEEPPGTFAFVRFYPFDMEHLGAESMPPIWTYDQGYIEIKTLEIEWLDRL